MKRRNRRYILKLKRNTGLTLIFWGCLASFFLAALTAFPMEAQGGTNLASCYGSEAGVTTASGETFDPQGRTAAHRTLPYGTRLLVRHEGRGITLTVNDYGPAEWTGRDLDLSMGACQSIGLDGVGEVEVSEVPHSTSEKLPSTGGPR